MTGLYGVALEAAIRNIAREEIASLAGLVLRRLQDGPPTFTPVERMRTELAAIFGEALRDFAGTETEPGER